MPEVKHIHVTIRPLMSQISYTFEQMQWWGKDDSTHVEYHSSRLPLSSPSWPPRALSPCTHHGDSPYLAPCWLFPWQHPKPGHWSQHAGNKDVNIFFVQTFIHVTLTLER